MVKITINDKAYEASEGKSILEVAQEAGIKIPTLCFHKELTPYGACRLCLVEVVVGSRSIVEASCAYKISEGLQVKTDTDRVVKARKVVFEILLAAAPEAAQIKSLAAEYGVTKTRIKRAKNNNCILCGLCVRACAEISERNAINFTGRGIKRKVQTPFNKISNLCIGCGACAYLCPTKTIKIEQAD